MSKSNKIPKTVQRIVDRLKRGQVLCRQRTPETGDIFYFYEPDGNAAGPATVEKAIALGLIKPAGDALFAEADSQTWVGGMIPRGAEVIGHRSPLLRKIEFNIRADYRPTGPAVPMPIRSTLDQMEIDRIWKLVQEACA